jgi:hypothetical protein
MVDGPFDPETEELIPKAPEKKDLVSLCRELGSRTRPKGRLFNVWSGFKGKGFGGQGDRP